jgi:hypothetical protein
MKLKTILSVIILAGFASLSFAAEDPRCIAEFKAEEARIVREAGQADAVNPPGRDPEAQQQFMIPIHDALKAAAERAKKCQEDSRRAFYRENSAAIDLRIKQCADKADRQISELRQRSAGRAGLSFSEQTALRSEENRISEERMECMRRASELQ